MARLLVKLSRCEIIFIVFISPQAKKGDGCRRSVKEILLYMLEMEEFRQKAVSLKDGRKQIQIRFAGNLMNHVIANLV